MSTPRKNAELAALYMSDDRMRCWVWTVEGRWIEPAVQPLWTAEGIYHVGLTPPTEPPQKMCELAGVQFPMPMTEAPGDGCWYYVPDKGVRRYLWDGDAIDAGYLAESMVHLTKGAAQSHRNALVAATKQAMENAE